MSSNIQNEYWLIKSWRPLYNHWHNKLKIKVHKPIIPLTPCLSTPANLKLVSGGITRLHPHSFFSLNSTYAKYTLRLKPIEDSEYAGLKKYILDPVGSPELPPLIHGYQSFSEDLELENSENSHSSGSCVDQAGYRFLAKLSLFESSIQIGSFGFVLESKTQLMTMETEVSSIQHGVFLRNTNCGVALIKHPVKRQVMAISSKENMNLTERICLDTLFSKNIQDSLAKLMQAPFTIMSYFSHQLTILFSHTYSPTNNPLSHFSPVGYFNWIYENICVHLSKAFPDYKRMFATLSAFHVFINKPDNKNLKSLARQFLPTMRRRRMCYMSFLRVTPSIVEMMFIKVRTVMIKVAKLLIEGIDHPEVLKQIERLRLRKEALESSDQLHTDFISHIYAVSNQSINLSLSFLNLVLDDHRELYNLAFPNNINFFSDSYLAFTTLPVNFKQAGFLSARQKYVEGPTQHLAVSTTANSELQSLTSFYEEPLGFFNYRKNLHIVTRYSIIEIRPDEPYLHFQKLEPPLPHTVSLRVANGRLYVSSRSVWPFPHCPTMMMYNMPARESSTMTPTLIAPLELMDKELFDFNLSRLRYPQHAWAPTNRGLAYLVEEGIVAMYSLAFFDTSLQYKGELHNINIPIEPFIDPVVVVLKNSLAPNYSVEETHEPPEITKFLLLIPKSKSLIACIFSRTLYSSGEIKVKKHITTHRHMTLAPPSPNISERGRLKHGLFTKDLHRISVSY